MSGLRKPEIMKEEFEMAAQNVVFGLNALFLAPAALMGIAAGGMMVKLFSALLGPDGRITHHR
jgi:hypothetical protein